MFTLPIRILPLYSSANSSRIGAIILQGPHHSAQKSTRIGTGDCRTSFAKFSCVRVTTLGEAMCLEIRQTPNHVSGGSDRGETDQCGNHGENRIQRAYSGTG